MLSGFSELFRSFNAAIRKFLSQVAAASAAAEAAAPVATSCPHVLWLQQRCIASPCSNLCLRMQGYARFADGFGVLEQ